MTVPLSPHNQQTSKAVQEVPKAIIHAGEAPITYVLVVDFKGFIHLKEQAQQYAYGALQ
jgi:hypothetical protein